MIINAFGKPCPMPLVMAKKEIDGGNKEFAIEVDNETAVKNLKRLAGKTGLVATVSEIEGGTRVAFSEAGTEGVPAAARNESADASHEQVCDAGTSSGYAVFVGKDRVGEGDPELGLNLMRMALFTLSEGDLPPVSLLFMNSGVKLLVEEEHQIVECVQKLIDRGTEVLVCGTCLDFYGLKESFAVGEVSNMYDILERMQEAGKVISL